MPYTEKEVDQLLKAVEQEFTAHLAKAEENLKLAKSEDPAGTLAKAEDGEKKDKKPEPKKEEGEGEGKEAAPAAAEGESKEAPPAAEGAPAAEGHEAAPAEEGHGYDQEDLAHMEKMYRSMSGAEQKAHSDCLAKCMAGGGMEKAEITQESPHGSPGAKSPASKEQDKIGKEIKKADGCGGEMSENAPHGSPGAKADATKTQDEISKTETGKIEANPPKGSPGPKSEASKAHGVQMSKSENTEVELLKSEVEAQKAKNDELKKSLDAVTEFIGKLSKKIAPPAKAITSLDVIAKSEGAGSQELSKSEVTAILAKKAQDPNLKKSDRDAINAFYLNSASIESVSHLLK